MRTRIPIPSLCVLIGASGAGKTTWAADQFADGQVLSSDHFRALVGDGEADQRATDPAFDLLGQAAAHRLGRRLTTVIDTTGLDPDRRSAWLAAGREAELPTVAVVFETPARQCRQQNRNRPKQVPGRVLDGQLKAFREQRQAIDDEGWDHVVVVSPDAAPVDVVAQSVLAPAPDSHAAPDSGLQFGLHVSGFSFEGGTDGMGVDIRAIAVAAEEAGFTSLRVMDHPVQIPQVGRHWDNILEPFTTLAHVAAVTDRLRVGPLVAGVTYRNIGLLGKTIASLDVLSGGRAECGIGLGWYERDHVAYGYTLPTVAERYARLRDALEFLPVLWGPGTKPWSGRTFQTPEAICYPRPIQDPLPIIVGGQGERTTLRLVAEHGVGCNLFGEREVVAAKLAVLAEHCADVGRDPDAIRVTHLSESLVGVDRDAVAALVAEHGPRTGVDAWRNRVHAGTPDDQIGRFHVLADAGVDEAIVALPNLSRADDLEAFAEVIGAFA